MPSYHQSFNSDPVLALHPQANPSLFEMDGNDPNCAFTSGSALTQPFRAPTLHSLHQQAPHRPSSFAGRKRSRDQAAENLNDPDIAYVPTPQPPAPVNEDEWVYGEGMTLIRPNGFIIDASSQSGTWVEEEIAQKTESQAQIVEQPQLRSFKSQRLDSHATPAISDDVGLNGVLPGSSPPKSTTGPAVDDFTMHLGIGWSRVSDDEHIQAAARGWAKYIENHYPVSNVSVRIQSKGLASYFVEAREGYFLFSEDLKQGRLVSVSLNTAFENLRSTPPVFEGVETLTPADTPTPAGDKVFESCNGASGVYFAGPADGMDLS